ncbi:hypothetical protein [Polaribacter sp.]|uniref:hypothetical protein n=1 Tax=Polaribacter sp. TaxID=1920175 RepID=UPI003EF105B7
MKKGSINLLIIVLLLKTTLSFAQDALWLNALGKTEDSKEIQLIHEKFGKPDTPKENMNALFSQMSGDINAWYSKGLVLSFPHNEYEMLRTITFYNNDKEYKKFTHKLPFGLSFTDTPATLKSKFSHVKKSKKYENTYEIKFSPEAFPNYYLHYNYNQGKVINIQLIREDYKSFSPFKIDKNGTDCEMIDAILKDAKYNFTHIRDEKNSENSFDKEWSSLLNPSFSKKTTIESNLIYFLVYKGSDLDLANKMLTDKNLEFINCVKENGYVITMEPRDTETSITFNSENQDFEIITSMEIDSEIVNGVVSDIYTCSIKITNYKEYDGCELFDFLYENSKSDFRYLKKDLLERGLTEIWDTNITTFNRTEISIKNKSIKMAMYNGTSLKDANSALAAIYFKWDNCKKEIDKPFIFIEDNNTLDKAFGSRIITYASYDDIYIRFKIDKNINTDKAKPEDKYNYTTSVSLYHKE